MKDSLKIYNPIKRRENISPGSVSLCEASAAVTQLVSQADQNAFISMHIWQSTSAQAFTDGTKSGIILKTFKVPENTAHRHNYAFAFQLNTSAVFVFIILYSQNKMKWVVI